MPNLGASPVDFGLPVGQVRALLGDTDAINVSGGEGEYMWFSDDEITAFLALYDTNPKRAAARALITVAGSQALLLKKWSADDLHVDGAAIAESLRKLAKDLVDEADAGDASIDIFVQSTPGGTVEYIPEGIPIPIPKIGRTAVSPSPDTGGWTIDGDGYIING